MPRQKNYCFTLNNPTKEDFIDIIKFRDIYCQYIEYASEVGESNTPHLQGWFILKKESSMKSIKEIALPRAHLSVMHGSYLENQSYCSKETEPIKWGQIQVIVPNLEAVMMKLLPMLDDIDIHDVSEAKCRRLVREKRRLLYICMASHFPIQCIRHKKGLTDYILDMVPDSDPIYLEGEYYYYC